MANTTPQPPQNNSNSQQSSEHNPLAEAYYTGRPIDRPTCLARNAAFKLGQTHVVVVAQMCIVGTYMAEQGTVYVHGGLDGPDQSSGQNNSSP